MPIVANIIGARPQFVKAGPVSRALAEEGLDELLVDTGQHYDHVMAEAIARDVGLRQPDMNLGVGSGSHAEQTARILTGVESLLVERSPDVVVVYGDTNSTAGAALAAVKLGVPVVHVEAGLRSHNRSMPEEINRVIVDRVSDVLAAPTRLSAANLESEGLSARTVETGDVMVDALQSIDFDTVAVPTWADGDYLVATFHRAANTDDPERLGALVANLQQVDCPVHLLAHPRLRQRLGDCSISADGGAVVMRDPLPYAQMLATLRRSRGLFTDSGGLQKEAYILGVPCVTVRDETEWPETLEYGWNVLARPTDDLNALWQRRPGSSRTSPFGDGLAARRVVAAIRHRLL